MDGPLTTITRTTKVNSSTKAAIIPTSTRTFRYRSRLAEPSRWALGGDCSPSGAGVPSGGAFSGAGPLCICSNLSSIRLSPSMAQPSSAGRSSAAGSS